jgi:hypothetical protein
MQYCCRGNEDLKTQLLCGDGIKDRTLWTEHTIFVYISFTNLEITLQTLYSGYALFCDPRLGHRLFCLYAIQADPRIAVPLNHNHFLPNSLHLTTYLSF